MNNLSGLLCIDKPTGPTSHDVVNRVRRLSGIRRVGHTGTLDPAASGLLILCIGRATRLAEYLAARPKTYLATVRLGQETTTYDTEGEIIADRPLTVSDNQLDRALDQFRGEITQFPPMYSAVKIGGQPLYRLARQGQEIERPARRVSIYRLELLSWLSPSLALKIVCSSGTYIRSIAHDLGQTLGCGGHLTSLRRAQIGDFLVENAMPLHELDRDGLPELLLPAEVAVNHLPLLEVSPEEAMMLYHGVPVEKRQKHPADQLARAFDDQGLFIGIVENDDRHWKPHKILYQP